MSEMHAEKRLQGLQIPFHAVEATIEGTPSAGKSEERVEGARTPSPSPRYCSWERCLPIERRLCVESPPPLALPVPLARGPIQQAAGQFNNVQAEGFWALRGGACEQQTNAAEYRELTPMDGYSLPLTPSTLPPLDDADDLREEQADASDTPDGEDDIGEANERHADEWSAGGQVAHARPDDAGRGAEAGQDAQESGNGEVAWPSRGSAGHPFACGQACKYNSKTRGCKDGTSCNRCHLCKWVSARCRRARGTKRGGSAGGHDLGGLAHDGFELGG